MGIVNMANWVNKRDEGMQASADHAESDSPGWADEMYDAIVSSAYLAIEDPWTIDFARNWMYACGYAPASSERAWGSLTQRLIRDNKIERVGFDRSASSNGSFKPTYRLVRTG